MAELNNHVILGHIDKPARILFWSVKQFGCRTLPVFLGMAMDRLLLGIAMSIVAMVLFKLCGKYFGNRGFATILYWYFPTSNRLMKLGIPPSYVRIWSK